MCFKFSCYNLELNIVINFTSQIHAQIKSMKGSPAAKYNISLCTMQSNSTLVDSLKNKGEISHMVVVSFGIGMKNRFGVSTGNASSYTT